MNIESTQIITNFDKKIVNINLDYYEEPSEDYNAISIFTDNVNSFNFDFSLYFTTYKYEQPASNYKTKLKFSNNNYFTELQLYGSNGFNYVFYTNIVNIANKNYYLLDIQNLDYVNQTTGDTFHFLDMSRGFKSDVLNYGRYNWTNDSLNYYNDVYTIDKLTKNELNIANTIPLINQWKNTGSNLYQSFEDTNTGYNVLNCESTGSYLKTTSIKKINNIYSLNDTSFNYQYNDYICNQKNGVINNTYYQQNLIINNEKTKTSNYTNSGLRNILTQTETIDLNYDNYITFNGHLSVDLVLLPVEISPEQTLNLSIFEPLENIPITATMTLGAVFSVPIVILFFMMIKRIAGI